MKRLIGVIAALVLYAGISFAESLKEAFKDNSFLTETFVNPMGVKDLPGISDADVLVKELTDNNVEFQETDLSIFGKVFRIVPDNMKIGGVALASMIISVGSDANMVIYTSEPSDDYMDLCKALDQELSPYTMKISQSAIGSDNLQVYMVGDKYGIAVGPDQKNKLAMVTLLDVKNLKAFCGLGGLFSDMK